MAINDENLHSFEILTVIWKKEVSTFIGGSFLIWFKG
jgi:hypothetical protein